MITETNMLDVPEIRHYRREAREGVVIVTYEMREPGEREWQPVRLVRVTEEPAPPRKRGDFLENLIFGRV